MSLKTLPTKNLPLKVPEPTQSRKSSPVPAQKKPDRISLETIPDKATEEDNQRSTESKRVVRDDETVEEVKLAEKEPSEKSVSTKGKSAATSKQKTEPDQSPAKSSSATQHEDNQSH